VATTDITDFYVFQAPGGRDRSVLVLNINPDASALESSFDPAARYELKIDTDGDFEADVAFHVVFASSSDRRSTATVYRSTGVAARGTGQIGEVVISNAPVSVGGEVQIVAVDGYRFYSGLRSDPFFLDGDGLRNGLQFTGHDTFTERNVFGLVLEVPNSALGSAAGSAAPIRLWARTMAPVHGNVAQVDTAGRPGIATAFNRTDADRAGFNETPPTDQVARHGARFVAALRSMGYPEVEAGELALSLLPDVLEYDPSGPGGYPNGRRLTDDVVDLMIAIVTKGRVTADGSRPAQRPARRIPVSRRATCGLAR
jgi:hypothetical protein